MSFRYKGNGVILPPIATQKITLKAKPITPAIQKPVAPSIRKPTTVNSFRTRRLVKATPEEKKQCPSRTTKPWRDAYQELYNLLVNEIRPFIQTNYLLVRNDPDQVDKKDDWIRSRSSLTIAIQKMEAHESKMFKLENAFLMKKEKCFLEIRNCLTQETCLISEQEKMECQKRIDAQRKTLSACDDEFHQIELEQVQQWSNQLRIWLILFQEMKERLLK